MAMESSIRKMVEEKRLKEFLRMATFLEKAKRSNTLRMGTSSIGDY